MKPGPNECKLYLDHIPRALAIDMDGRIIYMNNQCADYLMVNRYESLGKMIIDVFPYTQMIEGLKYNDTRIVFYNSNVGVNVP